jgi:two-component system nitrate/nitrite response regulator NarL
MPRLPGLEAMRAIMNGTPTVKILLLTSTITTQQIIEALHIGARGIVLKDALASHLQTAIRTVFTATTGSAASAWSTWFQRCTT